MIYQTPGNTKPEKARDMKEEEGKKKKGGGERKGKRKERREKNKPTQGQKVTFTTIQHNMGNPNNSS